MPATVDATTAQGSVVQATLHSALVALNSQEESIVQETPQGTVTVIKVASGSDVAGLVFQFDQQTGAVTSESSTTSVKVSVPASAAQQASAGTNLMVSLTQIKEEVTTAMPYKKANGDSVQYNSKVLEFSLLKESGGLIEVAEIANAAEPIYFRFHDSAPVEGDQCTFFDLATNQWSSEGVSLVDGSQIPEIGTPGTWCSSTHTSIFAVVQIIPFDLTHDPEAGSLNANSYVAATAIVSIFICCVMCPVGCVMIRRLRPAAAGKTEIQDSKGRVHVVNFKRSEVVEETKTIHEDEDDQVDSKKKVLVRWDVDPDRFMRRLNQLRGHRWVTMDMRANKSTEVPTMTKEASQSITRRTMRQVSDRWQDEDRTPMSQASQASLPDGVQVQPTQRSQIFGPTETNLAEAGITVYVEEEAQEEVSNFVEANITDVVDVCVDVNLEAISPMGHDEQLAPTQIWQEVYKDNAPVIYWSATHQRMLQGYVEGGGIFITDDPDELPCYDVRVGVRRQLCHAVPISFLQPGLQVHERVLVYVEDYREWKKGIVANVLHAAGFYQVIVFPEEAANAEGEAEDTEPFVLNNVTIERIRKRYEKNDAVLIWRGRLIGWMYGIVLENVEEDTRITPISSPRWTPREKVSREARGKDSAEIPLETRLVMTDEGTAEEKAPISSFDRPEAEMTMVQVLVAGEVEPETLPSFRVHILPEHVGI